ncbi:hypothetical protein EYZ11_009643 [Aspergillus tanneri]|uniref:Dynactin subunit 6 n=1 Tax=Aspergillus tanneri TaxID=1220188 RepID=A0A4V3UNE8_9EURO|nr:hypothetical protein EYZ11_009643 [Aspergillus tanneri]
MAHPTATIAETAIFQGTHAVSIGAGTVIHPRTRIYSFSGPVIIDEACIIGEKSVIGVAAPPSSSGEGSSNGAKLDSVEGIPIRFSSSVTVGPTVTILPGVRVHSGASIEALATIKDRVSIGAHARICAGLGVRGGNGTEAEDTGPGEDELNDGGGAGDTIVGGQGDGGCQVGGTAEGEGGAFSVDWGVEFRTTKVMKILPLWRRRW